MSLNNANINWHNDCHSNFRIVCDSEADRDNLLSKLIDLKNENLLAGLIDAPTTDQQLNIWRAGDFYEFIFNATDSLSIEVGATSKKDIPMDGLQKLQKLDGIDYIEGAFCECGFGFCGKFEIHSLSIDHTRFDYPKNKKEHDKLVNEQPILGWLASALQNFDND